MQTVVHPGPVRNTRMDLARCTGRDIEVTLAAHIPLEDAVSQALAPLALDSAWLELVQADVEKLSYVIPAEARMTINIRFNDTHTGAGLGDWLRAQAAATDAAHGTTTDMEIKISGESFLTPPGLLSSLVAQAAEAELGVTPALSTTGGTPDSGQTLVEPELVVRKSAAAPN